MSHAYTLPHGATVGALITTGAQCLTQAGVGFGHGTANAEEEAIWLVLWQLGLPIDAPLGDEEDSVENQPVTPEQQAQVATLFKERIDTRKPAAYLTHEAWLMGVPFYVDERSIVPPATSTSKSALALSCAATCRLLVMIFRPLWFCSSRAMASVVVPILMNSDA